MHELANDLPGLAALMARTKGRADVRVAVLDGPVDVTHDVFAGARILTPPATHEPGETPDPMTAHGTHVASVICGQPGSDVLGIAPNVSVIALPVFAKDRPRVPQVDLARGIEAALAAGAHIINLSAGQYADMARAHDLVERAVQRCEEAGVLLVAAAGNDGCDCVHVPAALPFSLAVGALSRSGEPMAFSNFGESYAINGLMAPGENILGAKPGGGTTRASGTSTAAPIVTAVAALLTSLQLDAGQKADPVAVRNALLASVTPCQDTNQTQCQRLLAGVLNIEGAVRMMDAHESTLSGVDAAPDTVSVSACGLTAPAAQEAAAAPVAATPQTVPASAPVAAAQVSAATDAHVTVSNVAPSAAGGEDDHGLVYVLGSLNYDFGTEARRDAFKQLMAPAVFDGIAVPANPYDPRQMVHHLDQNPSEAQALIWTVDLELTPLYAIEASGPYAADVYALIRQLFAGQIASRDADEFVERVSIPGHLTDEKVRLFSGQVVPLVRLTSTRGMFGWRSNLLVRTAVDHVGHGKGEFDAEGVARALVGFLDKVYYEYRNLGVLSRDRALNFAATNAFQAAVAFADALAEGMSLDMIDVEPSPYARSDADAWDVKLKFFDPENLRRARRVYRFTVDVSETMPVTMGEVRSWSASL